VEVSPRCGRLIVIQPCHHFGSGKKARLHRTLFQHGLRNGTAVLLSYDHGLEHGPCDCFANPKASDPAYVARLQAIDTVVRSANRTLMLVSGGAKAGDEAMLERPASPSWARHAASTGCLPSARYAIGPTG
jgi:hypothetical protein